LLAAGHTVVRGVRQVRLPNDVAVNFESDITIDPWLPRLLGADAVVNTVGLLGGTRSRMMAVHKEAPSALAAACAQVGIQKMVQVSALGVDSGLSTLYFNSKLAGEQGVRQHLPSAHVVRPSIVFGPGGDSSEMFMQLTRLPLLMLPMAGQMSVQPVHVQDLCALVLKLLCTDAPQTVATLGPEPLSMAQYLASLARQLGRRAPVILPMPMWLAQTSASLMQHLPQQVWTPETLAMLVAGSRGAPTHFKQLLGYNPRAVDNFISPLRQ
jgi:uncharacterized protein YbjT (DUF2867 family)